MKWWPVVLLTIFMILLSSCVSEVVPAKTPVPGPLPTPTPSPSPTPAPTPLPPEPSSRPTSEKPMNVTLHYLGILGDAATSDTNDVYLLLVITDGYRQATNRFLPDGDTFNLSSYQVMELDHKVFSTDSVGDSLKVCILVYKQNDPQWQTAILVPALSEIERGLAWGDYRSSEEILATVDKHMAKSTTDFINGGDSLIGCYEDVWGLNESLGVGQYNAVGSDDLRLWFSVWSAAEPEPRQAPVLLPDISLDHVNMVSTATVGQTRTDIICIRNKEPYPVSVSLRGSSSIAGDFCNDTVEVPPEGCAWVEKDIVCEGTGFNTISYFVYFRDTQLDSWSGDLRVISAPSQVALAEWRNSDASTLIERTLAGTEVTLYIEAPGYTGVDFTATVRRVLPDGSYGYTETVDVTVSNGRGIGRWNAKWQPVDESSLTYVFDVKGVYSDELTVVKRYEPPPDAAIDGVDIASYMDVGAVRTDTVTIKNNEPNTIVVRLKGYSSVEGEFYDSAVSIPGEGSSTSVEIQSSCETPGVRTITYKLYYQGVEFDSWSALLEVF